MDKVVFQSVEDRDGMIASGMEEGVAETMDRLAELLTKFNTEKDCQSWALTCNLQCCIETLAKTW